MKTSENNYSATDMVNFKAGVELGYSLSIWNEDPEVLKSVNSLVFRYKEHPFCRGLRLGFDKAQIDQKKEKEVLSEERMSEIFNIHNNNREYEDLER
jgi:hypothetical protein